MKSPFPKVLHLLRGKPLLQHVLEATEGLGRRFVIVGHMKEEIEKILPPGTESVWQKEQLGSGHALLQTESSIAVSRGPLLVLCGDVPFIRKATLTSLLAVHMKNNPFATLLTCRVRNPRGYGRIVEIDGKVTGIREEKDASEEEKKIPKINTGIYAFRIEGLFDYLRKIPRNPLKGEYYLTDVIEIAMKKGEKIGEFLLKDEKEILGVNTKEELEAMEKRPEEEGRSADSLK